MIAQRMIKMTGEEEKVWHEIVATLTKIQADTEIVIASITNVVAVSPDKIPYTPEYLPYTCNIGPIELHRTAELIKGMGFKPEDEQVSTAPHQGAMMRVTNRSLWVCPECFTVITNMEYEHLNKDGSCKECGNILELYKMVE